MASFAHLHVHTEFSLLDGMSRIQDLVNHTVELGMNSVAITDHGAMYGVIQFYRACKAAEIKPIIGVETYLATRRMQDKDPKLDGNYHLLLIAQNQQGYKNLLKIASASQLEGFYYRPRIDKDFLAAHSEGLICTSGCLAAEIPQMMMSGKDAEARDMLGWYQEIFGPDRFYIELQEHDIPELHQLNKALLELAPHANIPLLATNDVHYVRKDDAKPHDILLCIGTGSLLSDPKRLKFSDDSYYLRSPDEMSAIFAEVPEAISNSLKIAEMCDVNLDGKEYHLPQFSVPEGDNAATFLRKLCEEGLVRRYSEQAETSEVRERLEYELSVIGEMGFNNYFLIVWDLCRFAEEQDIWWNVRGSGAGSVVAYVLGITNLDPLQNSLLFERFLNPGRVSMPDIDMDFPDDRRAEMIDYCVNKYGEDKVAQIITFGTLGARAAMRDVARTMDIPLNEVDQLARLIPAIPGKPVTITQALEEVVDLKQAYDDKSRPYIKNLLDTASQLEGIARHASTHAAGVLIADAPLVEYTPLHRPTKGEGSDGLGVVSQWPMEIVESIGLLKVDFLGLSTLTIMRKACELIERYHGVHYNLKTIPYRHRDDDTEYNAQLDKAFELISRGETSGVFQVEGAGMTRMLVDMKPSHFEHIIAAISLFRPGPIEYIPTYIRRMHGEEVVAYHHPLLEPILSETFGICVYQEQIMQIASNLFGYSLGDADLMRRAVSKKKEKDLKKHRSIFQKNGPEHNISEDAAGKIFDDIEFFARYGFNKSHAADYAVLTVQTAFLKAHYPHEYMAALLTIERGNTDKVGQYINDCRHLGISVLPPDINKSGNDFTIEDTESGSRAIRYGMSAVKNVGDGAVEALLAAREEALFTDIASFCQQVDLRVVGKRALECLIKVGALDDLAPRVQLLESLDRLINFSATAHKAADAGQMSLFGSASSGGVQLDIRDLLAPPNTDEVNRRELLQWERELMGVYVSEHPLNQIYSRLQPIISATSTGLTENDHDRQVTMAGMVTYVRPHTTKAGKPMAFAGLEDLLGQIEVVIWPRTWEETRDLWVQDRVLLVRGKVDSQRGEPKLLCDSATTNFDLVEATPVAAPPLPLGAVIDEPYAPASGDEPPLNFDSFDLVEIPVEAESVGEIEKIEETAKRSHNKKPSNGKTPSQMPSPSTETPVLTPNGNGEAIVAADDASSGLHCHITVHMTRGRDPEKDRRKLQIVHGQFVSFPGNDTFSIIIDDGDQMIEVEFSDETTRYCDELIGRLRRYVSSDAIHIEEIQ